MLCLLTNSSKSCNPICIIWRRASVIINSIIRYFQQTAAAHSLKGAGAIFVITTIIFCGRKICIIKLYASVSWAGIIYWHYCKIFGASIQDFLPWWAVSSGCSTWTYIAIYLTKGRKTLKILIKILLIPIIFVISPLAIAGSYICNKEISKLFLNF